ncbi:FAD-dependent oxidoreductase [Nonomuraea sp. NPDC049709]|uniref:FAD-dependent oxidoreductase n=1 Tax=Nonomuraea sp. NPDC049709 TaxID=3154736 RepID=UPI003422F181
MPRAVSGVDVARPRVTGFDGNGRVAGVRLSDGRTPPADLVIAGMGVVPNTDWLEGSGLTVSDGVVCDERLFALGAEDVVAAGDVARWPHSLYGGTLVRVEHWSNANDQGTVAALNLLAGPENAKPFTDLPSFAAHAHGARIQPAGLPHLADESRVVTGDPGEGRFAVAFAKDGALVGAVAVNAPKDLVLAAADALARAFPRVPLFEQARVEVARLVELPADDVAARRHQRIHIAAALVGLATGKVPAFALGAGGETALTRPPDVAPAGAARPPGAARRAGRGHRAARGSRHAGGGAGRGRVPRPSLPLLPDLLVATIADSS